MVITYSKSMDRPRKVANQARDQLISENGKVPVPLRAWEYGLARRVRLSRPASNFSGRANEKHVPHNTIYRLKKNTTGRSLNTPGIAVYKVKWVLSVVGRSPGLRVHPTLWKPRAPASDGMWERVSDKKG